MCVCLMHQTFKANIRDRDSLSVSVFSELTSDHLCWITAVRKSTDKNFWINTAVWSSQNFWDLILSDLVLSSLIWFSNYSSVWSAEMILHNSLFAVWSCFSVYSRWTLKLPVFIESLFLFLIKLCCWELHCVSTVCHSINMVILFDIRFYFNFSTGC